MNYVPFYPDTLGDNPLAALTAIINGCLAKYQPEQPYLQNWDAPFEHYFQTVIYLVFTLLGRYALCEMHTFTGRIDCKVETERFVYLFEFKRDKSAEEALQQIEDKSYALPFVADSRKVFKIGVAFDSEKRMLSDWKTCEV